MMEATREGSKLVRVGLDGQKRSLDLGNFTVENLFDVARTKDRFDRQKIHTHPEEVHPATFACMAHRSGGVARVPMVVRSGDRSDPEEVTSGPLVDLFESPNPDLSASEFWQLLQMMQDADGAVLVLKDPIIRGNRAVPFAPMALPKELWLARVSDYEPQYHETTKRIAGWKNRKRPSIIYPAHQVILDRAPSRLSFPNGLSLANVARLARESDYLAAVFQRAFLENDCQPSVWVLLRDMLPKQFETLKELMKDDLEGPDNAGKLALLMGVEQVIQGSANLGEMRFLEGREALLEDICMVYGVPKSMLGKTEDVNRATAWGAAPPFL